MEEYSRESLRGILEASEQKKTGSRLVTVIIIAIFLFAGVFYVKTSKPELVNAALTYVKDMFGSKKSLETAADAMYDNATTQNERGESGEILKTAESLSFEYITADELEIITLNSASPLVSFTVTSPFGTRTDPVTGEENGTHHGIDLAAPAGSNVLAYMSGTVADCGQNEIYGNFVLVEHPDGLSTFYGHLSKLTVQNGDTVRAGSSIGVIGSTGKSTGVHLHFEIREDGERVDPAQYLYEKV